VHRAAERCAWLREMVDAGEIFHPLRWTPTDAFRLLAHVPELERASILPFLERNPERIGFTYKQPIPVAIPGIAAAHDVVPIEAGKAAKKKRVARSRKSANG
jgi:hypothetical protein